MSKKKHPVKLLHEFIEESVSGDKETFDKAYAKMSQEMLFQMQDAFWAGVFQTTRSIVDDTVPSFERYLKENYQDDN